MKKLFLFIPTLLLASMSLIAQKSTSSSNEVTTKTTDAAIKLDIPPIENISDGIPKYKFKETIHNFGNVKQNNPASFIFEFTNTGNEAILIESVKASCNCTTPEWTKESLPVGRTGKIIATFNSVAPGNFSKTVTVNFSSGEIEYLTIKGFVEIAPVVPTSPLENSKSN